MATEVPGCGDETRRTETSSVGSVSSLVECGMQKCFGYLEAVQKQQLVNESYVEISFDIATRTALADATLKGTTVAIYIADFRADCSEDR